MQHKRTNAHIIQHTVVVSGDLTQLLQLLIDLLRLEVLEPLDLLLLGCLGRLLPLLPRLPLLLPAVVRPADRVRDDARVRLDLRAAPVEDQKVGGCGSVSVWVGAGVSAYWRVGV